MPKITWKVSDNETITAQVPVGITLMEAAVQNDVPRVLGECGGCLSCATCHVRPVGQWYDRVGEPKDLEDDMLDFTEVEREDDSRLSCQITVTEDLDGLVLVVPG